MGRLGAAIGVWLVLVSAAAAQEVPVDWLDTREISVTGDTVTKVGPEGWNSVALSRQTLGLNDGYFEFETFETDGLKVAGLVRNSVAGLHEDILYGFRWNADGTFDILEKGAVKFSGGPFYLGDRFKIERVAGTISYRRNGSYLYASAVAPTGALQLMFAPRTPGATLGAAMAGSSVSEGVQWTNHLNTGSLGDDVWKSGSTALWDAGAVSTRAIAAGEGYVEFSISSTAVTRSIGLSNGSATVGDAEIDFCLRIGSTVTVFENGTSRGGFGAVLAGDVFRVGVEAGVVKYRKNGAVFYTSALAPSYPLLVDTSFSNSGGGLDDVVLSGSLIPVAVAGPTLSLGSGVYGVTQSVTVTGEPGATLRYTVNGAPPTTSDPEIASGASLEIATDTVLRVKAWKAGLISSGVTEARYSFGVTTSESVSWTALTNAGAMGDVVTKVTSGTSWDAGGISTRAILSPSGYLEFVVSDVAQARRFGLANGDTNASSTDIDFSLQSNGVPTVYELAATRGTFGPALVAGDVLRISLEGGFVTYRRNGALLYTSRVAPTYPLLVDVSISPPAGRVGGLVLAGVLTDIAVAPVSASVLAGQYAGAQNVELATSTPDAAIYYTLDGSEPSIASTPYGAPILITSTGWLKAKAFKAGLLPSATFTGYYAIATPATVELVTWTNTVNATSPAPGWIAKTSGVAGYNAGGSSTRGIAGGDGFLEARSPYGANPQLIGLGNSDATQTLVDATHAMFLTAGAIRIYERGADRGQVSTYAPNDLLRMEVVGGVVVYKKNGTVVYTSSTPPAYPLLADTSFHAQGASFTEVSIGGVLMDMAARVVTTSVPSGGGYAGQPIVLATSTPGASIYYTLDGSEPTTGSMLYTSPITLATAGWLKAKAFKSGLTAGPTSSWYYSTGSATTESVVWTNLVNASSAGPGRIGKNAGIDGFNGGGSSTRAVAGGMGYVETTVSAGATHMLLGFANTDTTQTLADSSHAFYLLSGALSVRERGADRGQVSTYATGDVLRVEVADGVVVYKKNGVTVYASAQPATYPLIVDTSLHYQGLGFSDVKTSGLLTDVAVSPVASDVPGGVYTNAPITLTTTTPGAIVCYTLDGSDPTASSTPYTAPITLGSSGWLRARAFKSGLTASPVSSWYYSVSGAATEAVTWTNLVSTTSSGPGSLVKSSGGSAWNAGAASTRALAGGDGWVSLTALSGVGSDAQALGFNNGDAAATLADLDHAAYLYVGQLRIVERGRDMGQMATYATGDVIKVEVKDGRVEYWKNTTLLYTSLISPTYPLVVDTAIHPQTKSFSGVTVSGFLIDSRTAAPAFTPPGGVIDAATEVAISAPGSTIRYTTDGTDPTTLSAQYSGPLTVSATTTIKAKAWRSGYLDSFVSTSTYTLAAQTPVIVPASGTYGAAQMVTITTATSGASLRYTLDGADPTASSTAYTGPIALTISGTVKARAFKVGLSDSSVATATITLRPSAPSISPPGGVFVGTQSVALMADAEPPYEIRYTTDGSMPTVASELYGAPFNVLVPTTLKAIVVKPGWSNSVESNAVFTPTLTPPVLNPPSGILSLPAQVAISTDHPGSTIRFTTDGSEPTEASPAYSGPVGLVSPTTLRAKVFLANWAASPTSTGAFEPRPAMPAISPGSGTYTDAAVWASVDPSPGTEVWFTRDGTVPTRGAGAGNPASELFVEPFAVFGQATLTAVAFRTSTGTASQASTVTLNLGEAPTETDRTPRLAEAGSPAGSYALSGFESVNLYNGNLQFRLPLLSVRGRGDAGFGVGLAIGRTFQVKEIRPSRTNPGGPEPPEEPRFFWPLFNRWEIASGYGPGAMVGRRVLGDGSRDVVLSFVEADGTEHELRGAQHNTGPVQPPQCQTDHHALAGSAATFIADSPICSDGDSEFGPSGNLHLRDGRMYRVEGGLVAWMRDRNGNKLSFEYNAPAEESDGLFKLSRVTRIVDSLGRIVDISYAEGPSGYDVISFTGAAGAPRTIRVERQPLVNAVIADGETLPDPLPGDPDHRRARTIGELFPMPPGFQWVAFLAARPHNPTVAKSVEIPDGRRYQFRYNRYGELVRAELPTGGVIEYERGRGVPSLDESGVGAGYIYRRVTRRRTFTEDGSLASETLYGLDEPGPFGTSVTVRHRDASGAEMSVTRHDFMASVRAAGGLLLAAKERRTATYNGGADPGTATPLSAVENGWELEASLPFEKNPRLAWVVTTNGNATSRKEFGYSNDGFNNQEAMSEFDHGTGGVWGGLLRRTTTSYETSEAYTSAPVHLRSLPRVERVFDGQDLVNPVAETHWEYDGNGLTPRPAAGGIDSSHTTPNRGNLTRTRRFNLSHGGESVTSTYYDDLGNVVRDIDPRGNETQYSYADRFGAADGVLVAGTSNCEFCAGVTGVTNPLGQSLAFEYDFHLGAVTDSADANGVISSVRFAGDLLDRPTAFDGAVGTAAAARTRIEYDDAVRLVKKFSDRDSFGDGVLRTEAQFDGLGRATKAWQFEGNGWIETRTEYDGLGRVSRVSNPFRGSVAGHWTQTEYDALGRIVMVRSPDGAITTTEYNGNETTVTDPAEKKRTSVTDALGRISRVIEDPGGSLNAETLYEYDARGNLTKVTQGGQIRAFLYDSLSRLRSATNPESGTTTYDYDASGNLLTKTDARGVETRFTYDPLNRPLTRTYVNDPAGTPTVTYAYDDASVPFATGRLTSAVSNPPEGSAPDSVLSHTFIDAYDPAGRVRNHRQITRNVTYPTAYAYNRAGATVSMSYPSGRDVDYGYDDAGRLNSVAGTRPVAVPETFISSVSYAPHGAVTSWTLGNGLVESTGFNNRLQPVGVSVDAASQLLAINYGYDPGTPAANNGNVLTQEVFIGGASMFQMGFTYDALNRLKTAAEVGGWNHSYSYDRFGNRTVGGDPIVYSTANNRIANWSHYDPAGNLLMLPDGQNIAYDAENRQVEVGSGIAAQFQYRYDPDGRRVTKDVAGGLQTTFVYGSSGQLVAEYSSESPNLREHIYFGSKLIAVTSGGGVVAPPSPSAPIPIGPFGVEDNCHPDTLFTFRWYALPGAVEYELEVDGVIVGLFPGGAVCDSSGFCSAEPEANQSVQPFAPYVDHVWRVRAILPGASVWSNLTYYRTGPGPATPLSPSGVWPRVPTVFEWRPWASGTEYTLRIDGNDRGTFGAEVCNESKCRVTMSTPLQLAPGAHEWRIDGVFPQCSLLSAPLTFVYDPGLVCTDFEQTSPSAGSAHLAPFHFTWRDPLYVNEGPGPPTPQPRTFIIRITEDASGAVIQSCSTPTAEGCEVDASCLGGRCSVSTTAMGWSNPAPGAYRWSIKEFYGEQCEETKFQVVASALGNPVLLAPLGPQTDSALAFRWEAVPGAASYSVFVENATPRERNVVAFDVCTASVCEVNLQVDPSGCDWEYGPSCKWGIIAVDLAGRLSQAVGDYWYGASPPASPTCEAFSGTCTSLADSCGPDAHSIGRTSCGAGDRCCVPRCDSDADCTGTDICDPSTGGCHAPPPPSCTSNSQCSPGQVCQSGSCIACSADAQCDFGSMCGTSGACIPWECASSGQCAANQTCEANRCRNLTCEEGGGACTPVAIGCEPGTHINQQLNTCGSGNRCCVPGCESDTDCAGGQACNTSTGGCYTPTPACTSNSQCSPGQVCQSGSCGACSADAQCDSGKMCDYASGACIPWQCTSAGQCQSNQICEVNRCRNVTCEEGGGTCTPIAQGCEPGAHVEQQLNTCGAGNRCCVPGCESNSDCAGGQECNSQGVCVTSGPVCGNGSCESGEDCNSCTPDCGGCPPPPGPSCGELGGDYCSQTGSCPAGATDLGNTYDCSPCCLQSPPNPGPSCGELGGDHCSQTGSCPAGATDLGGTYDCSPCCLEGQSATLSSPAECGVTMSCMGVAAHEVEGSALEVATAGNSVEGHVAADASRRRSEPAPQGQWRLGPSNAPVRPAGPAPAQGAPRPWASLPRRSFVLEFEEVVA